MYCPRCSQQQASEETKFCSRCGFPLGLVSEILAHGGFLPQLAEIYKSKKLLTRRNGLIFSLFWFLIFVVILAPFVGISGGPGELIGILALFGTVGSLMMVIASFLILKKEPVNFELPNRELPVGNVHNLYGTQQTALPTIQSQPAQNYVAPANSWKAPNTGEFSAPQSITEGTTKLLKKDEE
jgi:hypothetical protein